MKMLSLTSGGMCPLCICPVVICCCAVGIVPILKVSGPPMDPDRIIPGSATEPCSTRPTRLNCCCKIVDLKQEKKDGCSIRKVQRCNRTCDIWHIIFYPHQISNTLLYFKLIVCVCKNDIICCKLTHGGVLAMIFFSCLTRVCTFKCW